MLKVISFVLMAHIFLIGNCLANWQPENILQLRSVQSVVPSHDGKRVVYIVAEINKQHKWTYLLYYKRNDAAPYALLHSGAKISALQWLSHDKQIAYLSWGKKHNSIWTIDLFTKKKNLILEISSDIQAFKFCHNQAYVAFVADDLNKKLQHNLLIDVASDYTNSRLYLISLKNSKKSIIPITPSSMSIALWNGIGFDWAPDSNSLVYAYQPRAGVLVPNQSKLAIYDLTYKQTTDLSLEVGQAANMPFFSPNGKMIAFYSNLLTHTDPKAFNNDSNFGSKICVYTLNTASSFCLPNTPNANPLLIGWDKNSQQVYVTDSEGVIGPQIYAINLDTNASPQKMLNLDGYIYTSSLSMNSSSNTIGLAYETANQPPEAYIFSTATKKLQQISSVQPKELTNFFLGQTQTIHWQAIDGKDIEGLLVLPKNYSASKHYPLLVAIHGGPMEYFAKRYLGGGISNDEKIVPLVIADLLDQGFIIFMPNPRGSSGYGLQFRAANYGDWGGADYQDIMSGIDYLINNNIADVKHLALWGWSYGGYMTAWIIGHSNRFKAAVAGDGIYDLALWAKASDIPNILYECFGKHFWNNAEFYWQRSPMAFTQEMHTPLLLLHGDQDTRVISAQSQSLYTALNQQQKPVKMLLLPDQGHGPTDPNVIVEAAKQTEKWLRQAIN